MSSKSFGRSKLLREGYRKSPRLSALEDWKASGTRLGAMAGNTNTEHMKSYLGHVQGPASRTRGRKKRRLTPYDGAAHPSRSASPNFGPVESSQEDNQTSSDSQVVWRKDIRQPVSTDQQLSALSALWLPEKSTLELVLDILQRIDLPEAPKTGPDTETLPTAYESSPGIWNGSQEKSKSDNKVTTRAAAGRQAKKIKLETGSHNIRDMFTRSSSRKK